MLRLTPPEHSIETLKALAASGSSGLARKAQAELVARKSQALANELALRRAQQSGTPAGSNGGDS